MEFSQERFEESVYFKLEFLKACAAYAHCRIEGEVLFLADLFVEDKCVVPHPNLLCRLLGRKTLEVNFRKQGIGSQMLTTMIAYAKSKGLRRVEARLAAADLDLNPRLAKWYQKRGFTVTEAVVFKDLLPAPDEDSRYLPKG